MVGTVIANLLRPNFLGTSRARKRVKRDASKGLRTRSKARLDDQIEARMLKRSAGQRVVDAAQGDTWLVFSPSGCFPELALFKKRVKAAGIDP